LEEAGTGALGVAAVGAGLGVSAVEGGVDLAKDTVGGAVDLAKDTIGGTVNLVKDTVGGVANMVGQTNPTDLYSYGPGYNYGYSRGIPGMGRQGTPGIDPYSYYGALPPKGSNYMPITANFSAFGK